jgi:thiol:disulfide interchange protein DsbC
LLVAIGFAPAFASEDSVDVIFNVLKDRVGGLEKDQIVPSQVEGLYTVTIGFDIYYVSSNGKYLINGDVIELATGDKVEGTGLAAKRQRMLSTLSEQDMIVYPATTTKQTAISIFTDPTCPYCRKLHEQIPVVLEAGIDVRYLAFPRAGAESQVAIDMASIWCADDKQAAMSASKQGRPVKPASCEDPIAEQYGLGVAMQIRGTPAIILENGEIIAGYVPADILIEKALAATN